MNAFHCVGISLLGFVFFVLAPRYYDQFFDPRLRVTFFDVGQGDSAYIRFPGGKDLLLDAGWGVKDYSVAERDLWPALLHLGQTHIDVALMSHPDVDHGFGFLKLFEQVRFREFWFHGKTKDTLGERLKRKAEEQGIRLWSWSKNETFHRWGVEFRVWVPPGKAKNDQSLVLRLDFGKCSLLFPGDIEAWGEKWLLTQKIQSVDVLKVAHHGSRTSSTEEFLKKTRPKVGVISSGRKNRYRHPHGTALARLHKAGVHLLRTDSHGSVTLILDGENIHCESAMGECGQFSC